MRKNVTRTGRSTFAQTFEGQIWHLLFVLVALFVMSRMMQASPLLLHRGELWGVTTDQWFWLNVMLAVFHQTYVMLAWRLELHHKVLGGLFGKAGFSLYATGFAVLALGRIAMMVLLAVSNTYTFRMPYGLRMATVFVFGFLVAYTVYSVWRYFGFRRSMGIDHFDVAYSKKPFVREGAFAITSNAMYTFGLLFPFVIAIAAKSKAALLLAFFMYAYIWVHYWCTERPDIKRIYG